MGNLNLLARVGSGIMLIVAGPVFHMFLCYV